MRRELTRVTLPRHARSGSSFRELFDVPAADVLASMDRAGDDVPSGLPEYLLAIDAVGLERRDVVVTIADPFGACGDVTAVCDVNVAAHVPASRRGVHVSRMGQVIAESVDRSYPDVAGYADAVCAALARSQYGRAQVTVHARIPYLEEVQADASGRRKPSLEHLHQIVRRTDGPGTTSTDLGLRVTHLIACPCVQKTYQHAMALRELDGTGAAVPGPLPLMTHSQRCDTTVMVCGVSERISIAAMLATIDGVLFRTCNTLPRDAELAYVYRAHARPQFIEDALRAAVMATAGAWRSRAAFQRISGRSRSLESIHEYDLTASLDVDADDLPA